MDTSTGISKDIYCMNILIFNELFLSGLKTKIRILTSITQKLKNSGRITFKYLKIYETNLLSLDV